MAEVEFENQVTEKYSLANGPTHQTNPGGGGGKGDLVLMQNTINDLGEGKTSKKKNTTKHTEHKTT